VNDAPSLGNFTLSSVENIPRGTIVGTVLGRDEDAGQNASLSYALVGGESDIQSDWFSINATTCAVSTNTLWLDFESGRWNYTFGVSVTDVGGLSRSAFAFLSVLDANDAPSLGDFTMSSVENVARGTMLGTVVGRDEDAGQNASLSYALVGGDVQSDWFSVNSSTGAVSTNTLWLDFESRRNYTLIVSVTDVGGRSDNGTVVVYVTDVNDAPSLGNFSFTSAENIPRGTVVGTVVGRDEDAGQNASLSYALVGGESDF